MNRGSTKSTWNCGNAQKSSNTRHKDELHPEEMQQVPKEENENCMASGARLPKAEHETADDEEELATKQKEDTTEHRSEAAERYSAEEQRRATQGECGDANTYKVTE